jgi:hypothetical protein
VYQHGSQKVNTNRILHVMRHIMLLRVINQLCSDEKKPEEAKSTDSARVIQRIIFSGAPRTEVIHSALQRTQQRNWLRTPALLV